LKKDIIASLKWDIKELEVENTEADDIIKKAVEKNWLSTPKGTKSQ